MEGDVAMSDAELLVVDTVDRWAREAFPDTPAVARVAVGAALRAHAGGASVSEACREGRRFIECCRRHPSTAGAAARPYPARFR